MSSCKEIRQEMDPENIFVTHYFKKYLSLICYEASIVRGYNTECEIILLFI